MNRMKNDSLGTKFKIISVNGQALQIDASVFATSKDRGTIIDSGTTLAYLAEEAYDPFVNAITAAIPHSVRIIVSRGYQCFLTTSRLVFSVIEIFPQVSLNFAGGASLNLRTQDYLIQHNSVADLVLKDKIVVYDLDGQRIKWADYDCSFPFNVSATIDTGRHVNTGKISGSSCLDDGLITSFFLTFICCFLFL
ncbi:aspartic proteinase [Trifolium repens]|nr:aspartic proteinase [Trifolium repens]